MAFFVLSTYNGLEGIIIHGIVEIYIEYTADKCKDCVVASNTEMTEIQTKEAKMLETIIKNSYRKDYCNANVEYTTTVGGCVGECAPKKLLLWLQPMHDNIAAYKKDYKKYGCGSKDSGR